MRSDPSNDLIFEGQPEKLSQLERKQLEQALNNSTEARAVHDQARGLAKAARDWRDEKVPNWHHASVGVRQRPSLWLTWAPLAACVLMTALVIGQVRVQRDSSGLAIAFGGNEPSPVETAIEPLTREEMREFVSQAMASVRNQSRAELQVVMNKYKTDQDGYFKGLLVDLAKHTKDERNADLQRLVEGLNEQRVQDLTIMERQINLLLDRQNRNASQLYSLANYVNQNPQQNKENL